MSVINKLQQLMNDRNIKSKSELSRATGIPYSTISSLFNRSDKAITLPTLQALANYFNVSIDYLVREGYSNVNKMACHFDGNEFTNEELEEIEKFAQFIKAKRN